MLTWDGTRLIIYKAIGNANYYRKFIIVMDFTGLSHAGLPVLVYHDNLKHYSGHEIRHQTS